jgi:hypothetical protein
MTSVIDEQNILLPPSPPTVMEEANSLQLIHPEILTNNVEQSEPQIQIAVPDVPRETTNIGTGKFEYIENSWEREMLVNAWQAITLTENWDFVKQPRESFMMDNDKRIWDITAKMEQLGYYGHSGCSFGLTMRAMQYIAQNGEEKYKEMREKI